ncbi:MAG: L-aspartate oxidase [bacterium TMED88]|nr:L-aspartate oxidase [Deltaproteobacteria bacterium]OUV21652.1 MAG: L-aspartate oxidase [bacterium TMED88]
MDQPFESDFLVIGSGIAGLHFALRVAERGRVAIVTKKHAAETATNYAQGGIAAVVDGEDSFEAHIEDTLYAGAGLCNEEVVRFVVENGPRAIEGLLKWGVEFDRTSANSSGSPYDLGREGGHSQRRILHHRDATGHEIERALLARIEAHPNITLFENHCAVDLLTAHRAGRTEPDRAIGAYVLDAAQGNVTRFIAPITLLATGGAGKVYLYTSNPDIASGDGMAMAYRAGASVANMEFMQFHPTCLFHPEAKSFLISEAVRGEGATLRNADGESFMTRYHEMGDLAPRDVVARAIDSELKQSGEDCVYLDITHQQSSFIRERFPTISQRCLEYGIDMAQEGVPVVPAAHYCCGGVRTNLQGETDLPNLFAAGEVSCTGVHGANRLASNSLLEALVFADAAADEAVRRVSQLPPCGEIQSWQHGDTIESNDAVVITQNWDEIRRFMWNYVGIVRTDRRLQRAARRIDLLQEEINHYYWNFRITPPLLELRNLATISDLIIQAALHRKESRGLHYNLDYPERNDSDFRRETLLQRGVPPRSAPAQN